LTIAKDSRLYRVYRSSLRLWLKFTSNEHNAYRYEDQDNLCHLVRTLVVYGPCAVGAQLVVWGFAAYCVLYLPIRWYGAMPYTLTVGGIVGAVGVVVGVIYVVERLSELVRGKKSASSDEVRITGIRRLAKVYMESRLHAKICPTIDFVSKEADHA